MHDTDDDPFHDGERTVQELTGERPAAIMNGGVITPTIPLQAVGFVAQQELVVLSRETGEGEIWAGIAFGPKGFASVSKGRDVLYLEIGSAADVASANAPLAGLCVGDRLGGLFIELSTRRRLRVNGTIAALDGGRIDLAIAEAYPACPKYIQRRAIESTVTAAGEAGVTTGTELTNDLRTWIEGADTLFVASGNPDGQLDVSHRGGMPGFARVADGALRVPDYPGNSMFNTLGNLTLDSRAGIVVPDFATGRQLAMTGMIELDLDGQNHDPRDATGGTGRWWTFRPTSWRAVEPKAEMRWSAVDPSPFNPAPQEAVR